MKKILIAMLFILGIVIGYLLPSPPEMAARFVSMGSDENNTDYRYLESVTAFRQFQGMVDDMADVILTDARSEQEVIDGVRFLLRNIAMSVEIAVDGNPRYPFFQRMDTPARKIGGDNIDAEYDIAVLDGVYDYKITGNLGSVKYVSFTVNGGKGMSKRYGMGYIKDSDLQADENGNFTLWLSKTKPTEPGAWVQITEDASSVLTRQYIASREKEQLATYDIEAFGDGKIDVRSDAHVTQSIAATTYTFMTLTTLHKTVFEDLPKTPNTMDIFTGKSLGGDVAGESNVYFLGYYDLADDEALVVEVTPPDSRFWNLVTYSIWSEAPEYRYRQTSLTSDSAELDSDGKAQFVLSKDNPGHANWIDLNNYHRGFMVFRWVEGENVLPPKVKLVKQSEALEFLRDPIFD